MERGNNKFNCQGCYVDELLFQLALVGLNLFVLCAYKISCIM